MTSEPKGASAKTVTLKITRKADGKAVGNQHGRSGALGVSCLLRSMRSRSAVVQPGGPPFRLLAARRAAADAATAIRASRAVHSSK